MMDAADLLAAQPHLPAVWLALALLVAGLILYQLLIVPRRSNFARLPGPPVDDVLTGHLRSILRGEPGQWHIEQTDKFGPTFPIRGFAGTQQLFTSDPEALRHILSKNCYLYTKAKQLGPFKEIFGKGILFAEAADHARQRRILQSAFTQKAVDSYLHLFEQEADKLVAKLSELCINAADSSEAKVVDLLDWLSRTTLDVIGLTGFGHSLNALEQADNALVKSLDQLTAPTPMIIVMQLLGHYLPFLQMLPLQSVKVVRQARDILYDEGSKIIAHRRDLALQNLLDEKTDLMSLLYKANSEAENRRDKMSDQELAGQVATFILAGNETSSTTMSWILARLADAPEVQRKLRAEIDAAFAVAVSEGRSALSLNEIYGLKYLDGVIRETLRLAKAISRTIRIADSDDVIPLHTPIITHSGQVLKSIPIKKGQQILIGISAFNSCHAIYGKTAREFRPERWQEQCLLESVPRHRSYAAYSPQLNFLGGPRGCPGIRFACLEMKVILMKLVHAFEITPRDTSTRFRPNMVARPTVVGEEKKGPQLPVRLRKL